MPVQRQADRPDRIGFRPVNIPLLELMVTEPNFNSISSSCRLTKHLAALSLGATP